MMPDERQYPILPKSLAEQLGQQQRDTPLSRDELDRYDAIMHPERFGKKEREWKWGK
jgi:hypothetical protein